MSVAVAVGVPVSEIGVGSILAALRVHAAVTVSDTRCMVAATNDILRFALIVTPTVEG